MIVCYIIYSHTIDKYYAGITQESIDSRISKHNKKEYGMKYTSMANDWILYHFIECETFAQAVHIEKHIKRMKSRKYLEDLKKFPEMNLKLAAKYSTT
jgi:putative endonuclease